MEKKLLVRVYCPWKRLRLAHSKSKAWDNASRTRRSRNGSRRTLKTKACIPVGFSCPISSLTISPSRTGGTSYPVAQTLAVFSWRKSYSRDLNASRETV